MHMPRECPGDRSFGQRMTKDFAGGIAHLAKLQFTVGIEHGRIIKTLLARFLAAPNLQSPLAARASVPRRNDPRLQSQPTSSTPVLRRPELPPSPEDQTDLARR